MLETILSGCRVLDLTQNAAGPFRAQALGDFGAEVIKIEPPGSGDDARQGKPPEMRGQSTGFPALDAIRRACASISNLLGARTGEVLVALGLNAQELVELRRGSVID